LSLHPSIILHICSELRALFVHFTNQTFEFVLNTQISAELLWFPSSVEARFKLKACDHCFILFSYFVIFCIVLTVYLSRSFTFRLEPAALEIKKITFFFLSQHGWYLVAQWPCTDKDVLM
jgi:hypothetical protein